MFYGFAGKANNNFIFTDEEFDKECTINLIFIVLCGFVVAVAVVVVVVVFMGHSHRGHAVISLIFQTSMARCDV